MGIFSLLRRKKIPSVFVIAMVFIITVSMMAKVINVTSAPPDTTVFVDPPEISNIGVGNTFSIRINVSEALPTYSWEFYLNWDRTLLNVSSIKEGDFLHRWEVDEFDPTIKFPKYPTSFAYTPLNESNDKGEILAYCTLTGALPTSVWANGSGWLATLNFTVKSTGSTLLDLFGTRLWDQVVGGYPAPTAHSNIDCFFYNLSPPVHDIRISKVTSLPFNVKKGSIVNMNITVLNEGTETESSVTLNVKAGDTIIGTANLSLGTGFISENRSYTRSVDWNTTSLAFGTYNITASVPPVGGELDTADNTLLIGKVRVMLNDIAVTNVATNTTTVRIGDIVSVNVTIANEGSETETFDVAAYYNNSLIQSRSISSFAPSNQMTITLTWNTVFVSASIYTIKANVTSATDVNVANNEFIDGDVTVYRETGWPIANFTYSPLQPVINETITFTSTSYDQDGYIASWAWDFNEDGIIDATTETATWSYKAEGDHKARLIVHDNDTLTPAIGIEKTIKVYARPIASFTYSPQNPLVNEAVTFDASDSSDADGTIIDYSWDFGDGQTATGRTASHTYTNFGTYTVKLNVTDDDGFKGTESSDVHVRKTPAASFTFSPSSPLAFQTITFNASSSAPNGASIIRFFWDFGDDNFANETDPITSHSYSPADTYTVTLTVTDSEDLEGTATQSIVVGKLSSTTSINLASTSVTSGNSVAITGSITPQRTGVTVTIMYRQSGAANWAVLTTVTTNNTGQYSYSWTPTAAGTYEVKAIWQGDANTTSDESDVKTLTVQEVSILPNSNLLLIAGIIIVIAVAVAVYFLKFRKPKMQQGPSPSQNPS